jgi:hypothetical protein
LRVLPGQTIAAGKKGWHEGSHAVSKEDNSKQIARQHIQMTLDLNKANFSGKTIVTCNTCHQGQIKPASIPLIGQGAFTDTTRDVAGDAKPLELLPTVDQVFDKYPGCSSGARS